MRVALATRRAHPGYCRLHSFLEGEPQRIVERVVSVVYELGGCWEAQVLGVTKNGPA